MRRSHPFHVLEFIIYVSLSYSFRIMDEMVSFIFYSWGFLSPRMVKGQENLSAVFQAENTCLFIQALWDPCL